MKPYSRTRARDTDRESAIAVVAAAFADGQLDRSEHDVRVSRLQQARTFADLDAQLVDLQRPGQSAWRAPLAAAPSTPVSGKRIALIAGIGAVLVAGLVLPSLIADEPEFVPQIGAQSDDEPEPIRNPMTPQGWAEFLAALEEKTGDTVVFEANLFEDQVSIEVPVEKKGERALSYTWNGEWDTGDPGTNSYSRKDLSRIDASKFAASMAYVSAQIQEPERQDIDVFGNVDGYHPDACYAAYASNRFDESEMVYFRCDGTPFTD